MVRLGQKGRSKREQMKDAKEDISRKMERDDRIGFPV